MLSDVCLMHRAVTELEHNRGIPNSLFLYLGATCIHTVATGTLRKNFILLWDFVC
jgi:hypothetical protein